MPQIMPMNWLLLFAAFSWCLYSTMAKIHFNK